ncbi:MAG: hypothetical protein JJE50_01910, partial [Actinomycetales bacterium]|nr:hypothetical protein [Actinomycetales bacterium]
VETEPLPADSPLWDEPDVIISPHATGGRPLGADALITENLRALTEGASLRNVVVRRGRRPATGSRADRGLATSVVCT